MKTTHTLLAAGVLALFAGAAMADSSSGMQTTGPTVSAKATVNLSVTVPKTILLKVGSSSAISTAAFTVAPTVSGTAMGNNNPINNWDGTGPLMSTNATGNELDVAAWTNISGGAKLNYSASAFGTGGPALADFEVKSTGGTGLAHPGSLALGTAGTDVTVAANTLSTAKWTYTLATAATPGTWKAGSYTTAIVYTATAP